MNRTKNALLLFTKVPVPGRIKTRLTVGRGGILTEEEAASFYIASLLDVADMGFQALSILNENASSDETAPLKYDFIISCTPPEEQKSLEKYFKENGPWPLPIQFINDRGQNFDQHFDDAFHQLFEQGYHAVVSIGGDLPTMPVTHIVQAFQWLIYFDQFTDQGGFVQAPCQSCGVSLVGYTRETAMDSEGVFYNPEGVPCLDAYTKKAKERGVPTALLSSVADIDNVEDLAHNISLMKAIRYSSQYKRDLFVPYRTLDWVRRQGIVANTPPNRLHDSRELIDG